MSAKLRMAALAVAVTLASGGMALAQRDYGNRDRDDYGWSHEGFRAARDIGYQDGAQVAHEDFFSRKRYNPYPRGRYAGGDHGYRREFGDRYGYRQQYARAYGAGYRAMFGRGGHGRNGVDRDDRY
jgi:hypothetical protein